MGTSRSRDATRSEWTAGVLVFSGRPDPIWRIDDELGKRLWRIWARSTPAAKLSPPAPRLGYRGAFVRRPGGERVQALDGLAWQEGNPPEVRHDLDRHLERLIVASAPEGMLPPAVRELTTR
jgi:hypothetical protein